MVIRAFVSKIESLSDQSVKLSLHMDKSLLGDAVKLAYQEVNVALAGDVPAVSRDEVIETIKKACISMLQAIDLEGGDNE